MSSPPSEASLQAEWAAAFPDRPYPGAKDAELKNYPLSRDGARRVRTSWQVGMLTHDLAREEDGDVVALVSSMPSPATCDEVCARILCETERARAAIAQGDGQRLYGVLQANTMLIGETGMHWVTVAYDIEPHDSMDTG